MLLNTYGNALTGSFQGLWPAVLDVSVRLLAALIIFIIGWLIGMFVGKLIEQLFKSLKVDNALRSAGVENTLNRGGILLNSGAFVGGLVKWFIIVVFLIAAFQVIGLTQVTVFLEQVVVTYLPQVIVAVLILVVAVVIGDTMQKVVRASAASAHIRSSNLLGTLTKWIIYILAVLTVLVQLGIGADLIRILFTGIVAAGAIAFGLAFGLGGQQAAADTIQKIKEEISPRK